MQFLGSSPGLEYLTNSVQRLKGRHKVYVTLQRIAALHLVVNSGIKISSCNISAINIICDLKSHIALEGYRFRKDTYVCAIFNWDFTKFLTIIISNYCKACWYCFVKLISHALVSKYMLKPLCTSTRYSYFNMILTSLTFSAPKTLFK